MPNTEHRRRLTDACTGQGGTLGHCCWLAGTPCPFLVENDPTTGRRWACGIRLRHPDWPTAVTDPDYRSTVAPVWTRLGLGADYCKTWQPEPGQCCREAR